MSRTLIHKSLYIFILLIYFISIYGLYSCRRDHIQPEKTTNLPSDTLPGNINTLNGVDFIPSSIVYPLDSLLALEGELKVSGKPSITGYNFKSVFTLITSPTLPGESMSVEADGKIKITDTIPAGKYVISLKVTAPEKDTLFTNILKLVIKPSLPSGISYQLSTLSLLSDNTEYVSEVPKLKGGTFPFVFYISVIPYTGRITVDSKTGAISVSNGLPVNNYTISAFIYNAAGKITFENVLKITVTNFPSAPENLTYSPSYLYSNVNQELSSGAPAVSGTYPFTFSLSTGYQGISIHSFTGIITIHSEAASGIYPLDVKVSNSLGEKTFPGAFLAKVFEPSPPSSLTYFTNSLSLTKGNPGSTQVPLLEGTFPAVYAITSPSHSFIHINTSTGVISVEKTAEIGNYPISVKATNALGEQIFEDVIEIKIKPTSFSADISPFMESRCGSTHCHPAMAKYETAIAKAASIYDRITRNLNDTGFMPKEGSKLSDEQIQLIRYWIDNGLAR